MSGMGYSLDMKGEAKSEAKKGHTFQSFGARFGDNMQGSGITNTTIIVVVCVVAVGLYFWFKKK